MMRKIFGALLLAMALPVCAETLYVTERLPTALRAAITDGSPVVKTVDGGSALEVLDRVDRFVQVRDAQGAEGWIETRFLVTTPPSRFQLDRSQAELAKARAELTAAQARIGQLETKLTQESARASGSDRSAEQAKAEVSQAPAPVAPTQPAGDDADFPWGWLVLAFAMLWIGFGAGIVWLRERHRKKLGGMYLRV